MSRLLSRSHTFAIIVILDFKIHQSMWIHWPFFQKLEPKVIDPYMTFDPMSVQVTYVTLPKDHCVQVPWQYINVCGYSDQFCKIPHTYIHTHTYILRTEWVITQSLTELSSGETKTKILGNLKTLLGAPPRMKLATNPFFFISANFMGIWLFSFDLYGFFLASENDSWVLLTRKNHGQSL